MTSTRVPKYFAVSLATFFLVVLNGLPQVALAEAAQDNDNNDETSHVKFSLVAAATFGKRCTACHTFGKGIKVGPDLKGVNERRKPDWLLKFIRSSSIVIKSGDATAATLFAQFKQQRMPDWNDLSEKEVQEILQYLAVGGPDIKPADERNAELARPSDLEQGRQLFYGETRLKYGAPACNSCHTVQGAGMRGGSLGPDLTYAYERYRDQALTAFLRRPCFQWNSRTAETPYLTPKESFALKTLLYRASGHQVPAVTSQNEATPVAASPINSSQTRVPAAAPVRRRQQK